MTDFLTDPIDFIFSLLNFREWGFFSHPITEDVRTTFIVFDIIVLFAFIFAYAKALHYRPKLHPKAAVKKKAFTPGSEIFNERWEGVRERVEGGSADGLRLAIIEADKLADDALRQMGLVGEHMADRLAKLSESRVHTLDRLWRAHRVRNDLVHSPGFTLSTAEAKRAIDDYEAFLKEVKMLNGGGEGGHH